MQSKSLKVEIKGISTKNTEELKEILGSEIELSLSSPSTRLGGELLSVAFLLGVMQATPSIINAITNFLSEKKKEMYITFRVTSEDGKVLVEGSATEERLESIYRIIKDYNNRFKNEQKENSK